MRSVNSNPFAAQQQMETARAQQVQAAQQRLQSTPGQQRAENGQGNNLAIGSDLGNLQHSTRGSTVTVTKENVGSLGGDLLLTPQQTKELYEKGSLQVRREFQTAESNEGFMTLTAKLAAALVGPSRSIAAIQIDPLFLEMIKDPNAKIGMGYTQVERETWTVMPTPEQQNLEPPIMPPRPAPPYDVPQSPDRQPAYDEPPSPDRTPERPAPAGDIYRIARTGGQAGDITGIDARYQADGFPPLRRLSAEGAGDSTYDGATAEAILGRDMQVAFQYVGRANLDYNSLNAGTSTANQRSFLKGMATKLDGFSYDDATNQIRDANNKEVKWPATEFKNAVAEAVGLGSFENYQALQDHVKFVQTVGYTDPLNANALSGQVARQSPQGVQNHLNHKFDGFSLDPDSRHEYFTADDLKRFPSADGKGTRLDDYRSATETTPVPDMEAYRTLYNQTTGSTLSSQEIAAANPTLKDMYALHTQKYDSSLGITFAGGKANVPESSNEFLLNARIVLESNTSNGGEDQLLYDSDSVDLINKRVKTVFAGANMQLSVVDGTGQTNIVPQDKIVEFLGFHKGDAASIFNDVEADITSRYNDGKNANLQPGSKINLDTVGNGFIPRTTGDTTVVPADTTTGDTTVVPADTTTGDTTVVPADTTTGDTTVVPADTTTGDTTVVPADTTTGDTTVVPAGRPNYTSQSLLDAIAINTNTANSTKRFPPGTAERLENEIEADAAQLKGKIEAAGGSITVRATPPATGNVTITAADVDKMVADSKAPLEAMTLREAQSIENSVEPGKRPNYTSQSLFDAIGMNTETASSTKRFPPGTAEHLEKEIAADATQLKEQIKEAGGSITVQAKPPATGNVTLTPADVDKMVTDSKAPLEAMTLREAQEVVNNPQNFDTVTNDDGTVTNRTLSAPQMANRDLSGLNDYMRAALRDDSIQPAERDAIVQRVGAISENLFADLSNKGVVSGPYSPDTLNQITPAMIREKITDPEQANDMISAVENLNYTASQVGMISELNHATSLSRRVSDLSARLDNFQQIEVAKKAFTGEISAVAKLEDPQVFNNFVAGAYNLQPHGTSPEVDAHYDTLRTAAQKGELPFPPTIQVVDPSEINGADGAYVNPDGKLESGQILISRDILNQPERLRSVFSEEMFHHLERTSEISAIGDASDESNRGQGFEANGDEGRAAVYALRSIQMGNSSLAQITTEADKGRNQASTTRSAGNITMNGNGSDRGTYRMPSGQNASIEFSSSAQGGGVDNNTVIPNTGDQEQQNSATPGVGNYAGVNMDIAARNPNPTSEVDMRGVEAEQFNSAPGLHLDQQLGQEAADRLRDHPDIEASGGIPADKLKDGIDQFMARLVGGNGDGKKGIMDYAQDLQNIAEKFWKQGVANNLSNASSLMNQAQSLNGYHNAQPDFTVAKTAPNYSLRPDYQEHTTQKVGAQRDGQYAQWDRELAQGNRAQEERSRGHNRVVG